METFINTLRGSLRLEVAGPFPERFLNICAANGVGFWGVEWLDEHTLRVSVARKDARQAEQLGGRAICAVTVCSRSGAPFFLARFRRRYALLLGMALSLLAVCICSRFVLSVEVAGNETVTSERIVSALRAHGFGVGSYGPLASEQELANLLLSDVEELAYVSIHLSGVRAHVLVRERREAPELLDESRPADIYAAQGGLVTEIRNFGGSVQIQEGNTVAPGDLLISGTVNYSSATDPSQVLRTDEVRANGEIWARTWRTLSARAPLTVTEKEYTGRSVTRHALRLGEKRVNFYIRGGISFPNYDKITTADFLTLPSGISLALAWETETFSEFTPVEREADPAALEAELTAALTERLNAAVGEGGQVLSCSSSSRTENGLLTVTFQAECLEQIGKVVERQPPGGGTAGN